VCPSRVMGTRNDEVRTEESIRLLTYGFRFFETHKLYNAGVPLTQARVWKGSQKEIGLGLTEDMYVTFPSGQYNNAKAQIQVNNPIKAPAVKGQPYGTINIVLNNQVIASKPLVALTDSPKGGFWRSITDTMHFSFNKIFSRSTEKVNNG